MPCWLHSIFSKPFFWILDKEPLTFSDKWDEQQEQEGRMVSRIRRHDDRLASLGLSVFLASKKRESLFDHEKELEMWIVPKLVSKTNKNHRIIFEQ